MTNKMLIDASHPEETRVVVTRGNRIEEFDFESQDKKQLKGNIYLARVTRVEPSLQAAFVEYGGNRHGFLAFSEIHPDYYQIPVADRQALLRDEAEAARKEDDDDDAAAEKPARSNSRKRRSRSNKPIAKAKSSDIDQGNKEDDSDDENKVIAANADVILIAEDIESENTQAPDDDAIVITPEVSPLDNDDEDDAPSADTDEDDDEDSDSEGDVEQVGAEDAMEEVPSRRRTPRRHYKIQEVVKRRQILLVQVVKEERGNKGAALTTYLSLAGRYSVLMPNTARGGGISRKITSVTDRKRLKDVVKGLAVPEGMGVILRTAGANRTKPEIKRDYEYLMRLWENVRALTLQSAAPTLVYEEGSLIKRSVRDLYNRDISEILVAGEEGYREAKDFMRMLMPSHAKAVQPYRDPIPIYVRNGVEAQLDRMLQPQVTLKSGGYIIINQTEALVAIDVNSGRSTREHSIEDTALQTNLEAADEVARQLRLRDMAGLIVIDFIDMDEKRNNRSVEKRLKDCLKNDRARIQVGRISPFGLLEMSRQRIRASVLESTMQTCPQCGGVGHVRSESSVALFVMRSIEEHLIKDARHHITVRTPVANALYVLNQKRPVLIDLEQRFGLEITIEGDESVGTKHLEIDRGPLTGNPPVIQTAIIPETPEIEDPVVVEDEPIVTVQPTSEEDGDSEETTRTRKRRRRRRRGGNKDRDNENVANGSENGDSIAASDQNSGDQAEAQSSTSTENEAATDEQPEGEKRKRTRSRRGGRRNRRNDETREENSTVENGDGETPLAADNDAPSGNDGVTPVSELPAQPSTSDVSVEVSELAENIAATPVSDANNTPVSQETVVVEAVVEGDAVATQELNQEEPSDKPAPKPRRKPAARRSRKKVEESDAPSNDEVAKVASEGEETPAAPKPKRRAPRRKPVAKESEAATVESSTPEVQVAATTPSSVTSDTQSENVETVVEALPSAPLPSDDKPSNETAPASVQSSAPTQPSEPVITSNTPQSENEEAKTDQPRRGGWWQRRGFFRSIH